MKSVANIPSTKPWYKRLGIVNIVMLLVNLAFALAGLVMVIDLNSRDAWGAFLFFGGCATFLAYCMWDRLKPVPRERVDFDAVGITRTMINGEKETITWQALETIIILTTDAGPFVEDMFWVFEGKTDDKAEAKEKSKGYFVENGAEGFKALLSHIQTFEGFDNMQVIEAVGSTKLAYFLVWTKPKTPSDNQL
jgi:hypothetical protein